MLVAWDSSPKQLRRWSQSLIGAAVASFIFALVANAHAAGDRDAASKNPCSDDSDPHCTGDALYSQQLDTAHGHVWQNFTWVGVIVLVVALGGFVLTTVLYRQAIRTRCPACRRAIRYDATLCPYCRTAVEPADIH